MALTFEKQILKMFDGEKKQNVYYHSNSGDKYLNKDIISLSRVKVPPVELKKGLMNAFLSHEQYMNKEDYINETYFYEIITDMLLCLHKEEDVPSYYMNVMDAFKELNSDSPQVYSLDYFYFSLLYTLNKFKNVSDLDKVLVYYNQSIKPEFNGIESVLIDWSKYYHLSHMKRFNKKFLDREIRYSLIKMLDLLNRSSLDKQKRYKEILCCKNIPKEQIEDLLKFKIEFNNPPAKNISIKNIDEEVLFHFLGKENVLLLRKNEFTTCQLNTDLDKFILKNYLKEEIIHICVDRILENNNNSDKLLKYDRKLFGGFFFLHMNESHINKLITTVLKSKIKAKNNQFLRKIKCHKDSDNSENLIRAFVACEKSQEESKLLLGKIENVNELKNKKRI